MLGKEKLRLGLGTIHEEGVSVIDIIMVKEGDKYTYIQGETFGEVSTEVLPVAIVDAGVYIKDFAETKEYSTNGSFTEVMSEGIDGELYSTFFTDKIYDKCNLRLNHVGDMDNHFFVRLRVTEEGGDNYKFGLLLVRELVDLIEGKDNKKEEGYLEDFETGKIFSEELAGSLVKELQVSKNHTKGRIERKESNE